MPGNKDRFLQLYKLFIEDKATAEEVNEFWQLAEALIEDEEVSLAVYELYDEGIVPEFIQERDWSASQLKIFGEQKKVVPVRNNRWWAAAAAVLLIVGVWVLFPKEKESGVIASADTTEFNNDVQAPASTHATVTLSDGSRIALDDMESGLLATEANVALTKGGDGSISYIGKDGNKTAELIYNTLTNPRGSRVVNMVLNDGSRVWLNAGSSVTYPVAFGSDKREVSISGEAYFEIAHEATRKFIVRSNGVETEVLGTHFNVNSYPDEDGVRVTLVSGSVSVKNVGDEPSVIKPGEQAFAGERNIKILESVNVADIVAWKDERFSFHNTNIRDIMKEMARWYDVEVEFNGKMDDLNFGGSMSRQKNISELLKRMEATKAVSFKVEGKKVTVLKSK